LLTHDEVRGKPPESGMKHSSLRNAMNTQLLQNEFPMGLTSLAMKIDDFSDLLIFKKHHIGLLEVLLLEPSNKAWTVGEDDSTADFLSLCQQHQVRPYSVHGYFLPELGHDVVDADPDIRKKAIDLNLTLFQGARDIGAEYVIMHLYGKEVPGRSERETLSLAREAVFSLLPEAEKTGIAIAVENLAEKWSIRQINTILDDINHPLLGIWFDTGHSALYGQLEQELELCRDRLFGLHVHDNNLQNDDHIIPFRGKIDWKAFSSVLVRIGYRGPLIIEAFTREEGESSDNFIMECQKAYVNLIEYISEALRT
jgi:sugar phosphate isomerase/epimerase